MRNEPWRSTRGSPEAVLAEARRLAADIRRRAERDAAEIRREAAEWAARTRREAELHRMQVHAELEHEVTARRQSPGEPDPAPAPAATEDEPSVVVDPGSGAVIDLRSAAAARRVADVIPPPGDDGEDEYDAVRLSVHRTFHRRFP